MIFLGILFGLIIMGIMVYMALNKKSPFNLRVASLAALALMILTVIICLFIIFTDDRVPVDESVIIVGAIQETQEQSGSNIIILLLFIVFLAGLFITIAYFSMKEQRKNFPKFFHLK